MKKIIINLIIIIILVLVYSKFIAPNLIKVNEYDITVSSLSNGFNGYKIVHFANTLYNEDYKKFKKLINKINEQKPDLVIFTGSLINKNISSEHQSFLIKYLKSIDAKKIALPFFDNDIENEIFLQSNFKVLNNASEYLFNNDINPILILGQNEKDTTIVKNDNINSCFKIVLTNSPDLYDNFNDANMVLSSINLKNNFLIPFYGPLFEIDNAKKYYKTSYFNDNKYLYISYGIGPNNTMRLFNVPSFNIYRIYNSK